MEKESFSWPYAIFTVIVLLLFGIIFSSFASLFSGESIETFTGNVAVIPVNGVIMADSPDSFFDEDIASSTDIVELIEEADENDDIKAIIFEINSQGGSAVASQEIADAIEKVNKTTVAWIREVGASGAYWVASSTDHIVANRASITGSIGVIASYLEFGGLLDRYNVSYERLISGKYKDIGDPFREMTSEERAIFQQTLDEMKDYFASEVARNRHMSKKDIDKVANGLFYTGFQAKELGLVDELGGLDEAISYVEEMQGIEAELVEYEVEKSLLDLFSSALSKQSFFIGKGIGSAMLEKRQTASISIST